MGVGDPPPKSYPKQKSGTMLASGSNTISDDFGIWAPQIDFGVNIGVKSYQNLISKILTISEIAQIVNIKFGAMCIQNSTSGIFTISRNCRNSRDALIKVRSSMRDQDLNERPGGAPPQSQLENPGETKTKQKRSPSTNKVEPRKAFLILQITQWQILTILGFQQF